MDFVTDLPLCGAGYTGIFTIVDRLTKFVRLIPVSVGEGALSAEQCARLFFQHIVVLFGMP